MPNITAPAAFEYVGGGLRTMRLAPARLRYSASTQLVTSGDTPLSAVAEIPTLDRLTRWEKPQGYSAQDWERQMAIWQKAMGAIEDAFVAVNARVDEVALFARLSAVEAKAEVANDNANTALNEAVVVREATRTTFAASDQALQDAFDEELERLQDGGVIP